MLIAIGVNRLRFLPFAEQKYCFGRLPRRKIHPLEGSAAFEHNPFDEVLLLRLVRLTADCDDDTLLYIANPVGPTCHTGETSCFFKKLL